ncbi:hypothetical protein E2562_013154 [Oryza meyeriana var. granulata]|uniref:Uncharacterized protein n=1 Tax=Oryza meyeriana var. granulata TaxID=110450 RepID=A0A6G1F7U8_9ORYZ|nr:hypothetical protein E2562_013154 [Oryza meyeriana var. granulata]
MALHAQLFQALETPIMVATPQCPRGKSHQQLETLRHSKRQAARHYSVLVSQRAQVRIMKEVGLLEPSETVGDEAVQEYISTFDTLLPSHVVEGIRALIGIGGDGGGALPPDVAAAEDGLQPQMI